MSPERTDPGEYHRKHPDSTTGTNAGLHGAYATVPEVHDSHENIRTIEVPPFDEPSDPQIDNLNDYSSSDSTTNEYEVYTTEPVTDAQMESSSVDAQPSQNVHSSENGVAGDYVDALQEGSVSESDEIDGALSGDIPPAGDDPAWSHAVESEGSVVHTGNIGVSDPEIVIHESTQVLHESTVVPEVAQSRVVSTNAPQGAESIFSSVTPDGITSTETTTADPSSITTTITSASATTATTSQTTSATTTTATTATTTAPTTTTSSTGTTSPTPGKTIVAETTGTSTQRTTTTIPVSMTDAASPQTSIHAESIDANTVPIRKTDDAAVHADSFDANPVFSLGIRQPSFEDLQSRPVVFLSTAIIGLLVLWILSRLRIGRSRSTSTARCCCAKLVNNRKPTTSNLSGETSSAALDPSAVQAIRHQIYMIHTEVVKLKSEREAVDNELIETSTQILQSLGDQIHRVGSPGTDVPLSSSQVLRDLTYDDLQNTQRVLPVVAEQEVHVPQTVRVQPVNVDHPVVPANSVQPAPIEPGVRIPVPKSIPPSTAGAVPKETNPAVAAPAPKMSAIAAARMKRETEVPPAKPGGAAPALNPFGQPAKGPFGR